MADYDVERTICRRVQSALADAGVTAEVTMYLGNVRILVSVNTVEDLLGRVGK